MSGLLSKLITDGSVQLVATVPDCTYGLLNILVVNPTANAEDVKLWLTMQAAPGDVDLIDPGVNLVGSGGRAEYSCVTVSPGEKLYVQAPVGLAVRVTSVEETV